MTETIFTVTENKKLCEGVFSMTLKADAFEEIKCGQFINIEVPNRQDLLLRRPFAICDFDCQKKTVVFCYKIAGSGTEQLSKTKQGERLRGTFPLGNGFSLNANHKTVILIGGGVGIFPLLSVGKCYPDKKIHTLLGFRCKDSAVLIPEFEKFSKEVLIATEDGSLGASGYVTDSLKRNIDRIKPDIILACGPKEMFRSLKSATAGIDVPVMVSLEERMGCGIGACLVCTCAIKGADGNAHNKRVCKDGPVFNLKEVVL